MIILKKREQLNVSEPFETITHFDGKEVRRLFEKKLPGLIAGDFDGDVVIKWQAFMRSKYFKTVAQKNISGVWLTLPFEVALENCFSKHKNNPRLGYRDIKKTRSKLTKHARKDLMDFVKLVPTAKNIHARTLQLLSTKLKNPFAE